MASILCCRAAPLAPSAVLSRAAAPTRRLLPPALALRSLITLASPVAPASSSPSFSPSSPSPSPAPSAAAPPPPPPPPNSARPALASASKPAASRLSSLSSPLSSSPALQRAPPTPAELERAELRCAIFDKDGTLFDVRAVACGWAVHMAARLGEAVGGAETLAAFEAALGFDLATCDVAPTGVLAQRPWVDIYSRLATVVKKHTGLPLNEAAMLVQGWRLDYTPPAQPGQLFEIAELFEELKMNGIKVAISTVDDRDNVLKALEEHRLTSLVDHVVAGDDMVTPKPHRDNAHVICSTLNVKPTSCITIGDTIADVVLARIAHLGASVGVTSGVSRAVDLHPYADYVVPLADSVALLARGEYEAFCAQSDAYLASEVALQSAAPLSDARAAPDAAAPSSAAAATRTAYDEGGHGGTAAAGARAHAFGAPMTAARQPLAKGARPRSAFVRAKPGVFPK